MINNAFLMILVMTAVAYGLGRMAGNGFTQTAQVRTHSLPSYHGSFVALWVGVPAFFLVILWAAIQGSVLDSMILASLPDSVKSTTTDSSLLLSEIRNLASGKVFQEPAPEIAAAAERLKGWTSIAELSMLVVTFAAMALAMVFAKSRLNPRFRARNRVEQMLGWLMIGCSTIAVATTIGIFVSLVYEAIAFFRMVPLQEFLFGLKWEPQIALRADQVAGTGAFGVIPVFAGTLLISLIAMLVAVPVGLLTAVYLVEYAGERARAIIKPILELLAGIPTVVFGFFAILVIAPAIRDVGDVMGLATSSNSALAAGLVMGIMIIPFVSSLSDDAIRATPRALRDGSLALGATSSETMVKVLLPAAIPGIVGGILLAVSRAIGETMIVAMAAGLIATLTLNPLDSVTTVTVQIVTLLTGDSEFDSPKTLAAFALGLMLFLVTLALNVLALRIVRKYREQYE